MQRADAATAEPVLGSFAASGPWSVDVLIGPMRLTMPLRAACADDGADVVARCEVLGHPNVVEEIRLSGAAPLIGALLRRLAARYALALAEDAA